jgi:ABC-2 type transport system ATP-binding protein
VCSGSTSSRRTAAVRQRIGLTGQYAAVDELLTGRENLRCSASCSTSPPGTRAAGPDELLERFDLTDAADRPARTYSGGMRRRLDLASSLLVRPSCCSSTSPPPGSTRAPATRSGR